MSVISHAPNCFRNIHVACFHQGPPECLSAKAGAGQSNMQTEALGKHNYESESWRGPWRTMDHLALIAKFGERFERSSPPVKNSSPIRIAIAAPALAAGREAQ